MKWKILATLTIVIAVLATFSAAAVYAFPSPTVVGQVYTINNLASNSVLRFDRWSDGALTPAGTFNTYGDGTGTGFHSQGAVVLNQNGEWLLVVDAGSNQITAFQVQYNTLTFSDIVSSHGTMPISLTISGNLVYVLNSGGYGNIAGFWLSNTGKLTYITGSSKPILPTSTDNSPEQIGFNPQGNVLAVTCKSTNTIDTYTVGNNGVASAPTAYWSAGNGPYGFAFNCNGYLIDSEAASASASSYSLSDLGILTTISGEVSNGGHGTPCWVAITGNGKIAYTGNAGGGISIYAIAHDGVISLITGEVAVTPGPALDLALSKDSQFLYVNEGGQIAGYSVSYDGSLTYISTVTGLAASTTGLAAT